MYRLTTTRRAFSCRVDELRTTEQEGSMKTRRVYVSIALDLASLTVLSVGSAQE